MNDEQFEESLQVLEQAMWPSTAEKLRARDTAQREALARVEAAYANRLRNVKQLESERDTAQAQLAEAVGLLRKIDSEIWPEWDRHGSQAAALINVKAFLADYAQAEQQEAREETLDDILNSPCAPCEEEAQSHPTAHQVGYCGGVWTCNECTPNEAQGAQAGDERAAFEGLAKAQGLSVTRTTQGLAFANGTRRDAGDYIDLLSLVSWHFWQARAALATQPAAGEPVVFDGKTVADRLDQMADAQPSGSSAQSDLYAAATVWRKHLAPPAAAHGDEAELRRQLAEAVDFLTRLNRSRSYKGMLSIMLDAKEFLNRRRVAMRAQGDGEVQ